MATATTRGVKVSVEVAYSSENSYPEQPHHAFIYHITIINNSEHTVQLLRRQWYIFDSAGELREVEGEGVVGETPVLQPGEMHEYTSWSPLRSEVGRMYGTFLMRRLTDGKKFKVRIPAFNLVTPYKMN